MTTGDAPWKLREPRVVVTANIPDNTDVDYSDPPCSEARSSARDDELLAKDGVLGEEGYPGMPAHSGSMKAWRGTECTAPTHLLGFQMPSCEDESGNQDYDWNKGRFLEASVELYRRAPSMNFLVTLKEMP